MALWSRYKILRLARGYNRRSKNCFKIAIKRVFKALQYEYRDRRVRRREIRTDWIRSINAAVRDQDVSYSRFIYGLNRSNIELDRKILSDMARNEPYSFKAVLDEIKTQVPLPSSKNPEKMSFQEAIDKKMLHYGEYDATLPKDVQFKFVKLIDPKTPDWYGLNDPNFPENYKKQRDEAKAKQMPLWEMKRKRFTEWDDIPSEPDDE